MKLREKVDIDQSEVIGFLLSPAAWLGDRTPVEHIETHGAHVFLGRDIARKIKRAVRYSYLDFSTPEKRKVACEREIEINQPAAPEIYLVTRAITRESDGTLAIAGAGPVVEWTVEMRRFDQAGLLSRIARAGPIDPVVVKKLAITVHAAHARAPVRNVIAAAERTRKIAADVTSDRRGDVGKDVDREVSTLTQRLGAEIDRLQPLLDWRNASGFVRRCHGDLHLNNIVVIDGRPLLFDALEFDEDLATVDTMYDLAFLLMDLVVAGQLAAANLLLNHYVWLAGDDATIDALATLPAFLALRASIRALVGLQKDAATPSQHGTAALPTPRNYITSAISFLNAPAPRLIAIGGFSGTGKSTLAAALAPLLGRSPGALHLRSDLERKAMFRVGETDRLPVAAYTSEANAAVYHRLHDRARRALQTGHSVIVDAVFSTETERLSIEAVARDLGTSFAPVWLDAPVAVLTSRIESRRGDASDATAAVAHAQIARGAGALSWPIIDAASDRHASVRAASAVLGL